MSTAVLTERSGKSVGRTVAGFPSSRCICSAHTTVTPTTLFVRALQIQPKDFSGVISHKAISGNFRLRLRYDIPCIKGSEGSLSVALKT